MRLWRARTAMSSNHIFESECLEKRLGDSALIDDVKDRNADELWLGT